MELQRLFTLNSDVEETYGFFLCITGQLYAGISFSVRGILILIHSNGFLGGLLNVWPKDWHLCIS